MAAVAEWAGLIALAFTAGYAASISARVVASAIRTGRTIRRGGFVSRRERPVEFWASLVFWVAMAAIIAIACAFMMWAVVNRRIG